MTLEELITKTIVEHTMRDWIKYSSVDIVIVGAGPSGLTAAYYLAKHNYKTLVLERRLSFGGGIGGGGMLFHKIVIEKELKNMLDELKVKYITDGELMVVDAAELMAKLASNALDAGAKIIHGVTVEDVIYRDNPLRITGVVIQWSAVPLAGLHVDPLFIHSKAVVDATGHEAEVLSVVKKKVPASNIEIAGESSAYSEKGEELVVKKSGRVLPGLYVTGMAVAALYRLPRMGPIFGGMLLSGKRVAEVIDKDLRAADSTSV